MTIRRFEKKKPMKKRKKLPVPERKDREYSELEKNLMLLEYRFGFFALKNLEADINMRKNALKLARKRHRRGLSYRV